MCHIFHSWILMSEERIILTAVEYRPASEKRRWSSISAVGSASDRQTPSMKRASRHHWSQPRRQRLHDHWGSWTRQRWTWITRNTHTQKYIQTNRHSFLHKWLHLLTYMFINPFQNHGDRDKIYHHIHHHSQTVPSSHTGEWTDNMIHSDLLQVLFCPSTTMCTKHLGTSTSSKVVQSFLIFK